MWPEKNTASRRVRRTLAGCALAFSAACGADEASFSQQVMPLLNSHCVMCHLPGAAQAGLNLYPDAWQALVNRPSTQSKMPLVEPGNPEGSYLFRKLSGTHLEAGGNGDSMPFQREKLATPDLAVFRDWIAQGAKNN